MTAISAVIITYNEERNIERCLKSLQHVVDEVVVFDSNSTDNTKAICEKYGATVVKTTWKGYAQTKNEANAFAKHNYILWLDADEALSDDLKESIATVKENLSGAYTANRLNNYCGKWLKHGGYYPDKKIRLFPKDKVSWQGDFVHETLVTNETISTNHLNGDVLHYSYYTTNEHMDRAKKYAALAAEKLKHKSKVVLLFKFFFSPGFLIIKKQFLQLGFLDGPKGIQAISIGAYEVYLKYRKALFGV